MMTPGAMKTTLRDGVQAGLLAAVCDAGAVHARETELTFDASAAAIPNARQQD